MVNTSKIAGHVGRAAISVGKSASSGVQAAHGELPLPQAPSYVGYWTFVTATIILAFVLYLAQKNRLGVWLAFFSWSNPLPVGTTGQTSTAANPNVGTVVGATATQPGLNLNNPFAGIPGLGTEFQSLLPGNSQGSATQSTPGQANPIPWGQVGTWLKSFLPGS
jgi:hypothetical protein